MDGCARLPVIQAPQDGHHDGLERGEPGIGGHRVLNPALRIRPGVAEGGDRLDGIGDDPLLLELRRIDRLGNAAIVEGGFGDNLAAEGGDDLIGAARADPGELRQDRAVFLFDGAGDGADRDVHRLRGLCRPDALDGGELAEEVALGAAEEPDEHRHRVVGGRVVEDVQADFGAEPNSQVSFVDAAMPGMLPVINEPVKVVRSSSVV